jgi:tetratricopeptide (TPR) repeat protein
MTLESLLAEGKIREARAEAEKLLRKDPENGSAQLTMAKIAVWERDFDRAQMFLNQAQKRGETPATRMVQATLFASQGRLPQAREIVDALAKEPNPTPEVIFTQGMIASQEGRLEDALAAYQRVVAAEPRQAVFHYHLAETLARLEREPPKVLEHLRQAITINPLYPQPYALLSRALILSKKFSEAKQLLEEGLRHMPGNPLLTSNLTNLALITGDVGGAFQTAAALAQRFPDDPGAVSNLALLLMAQQRWDEVLQICRAMSGKGKANASLKEIEATALEAQKPPDFEGAARCYEEAMALEPGDWKAANNLGQLLMRRQDGDVNKHLSRAVTVLEEALRRKPKQPEPMLNLALAYVRVGKKDQSLKLANELVAMGLPPQHPIADQARRLVAAIKRG